MKPYPNPRFTAPLVVGVQQFRDWQEAGSVEATLAGLGHNTGNMMFTHSLVSVLDGAVWGSFALRPDDLLGRDVIVVACANWINSFEDFGWLADRLEKTTLPVILIGIGAQSSLSHEIPTLKPGTHRLLSIAAERSGSISTRGQFSSHVLASLGFRETIPTGCPSLLLAGRDGPVLSVPNSLSSETTCIHATRHGYQTASDLDQRLYRLALQDRIDIVLQSETPDIMSVQGETLHSQGVDRGATLLESNYGSDKSAVSSYLHDHGRSFTNVPEWIDFMRTKSFCIGTRIHGTVASVLAGTPAILIVHDSRTLEMAKAMSIPFVTGDQAEFGSADDLCSFYTLSGMAELVKGYRQYQALFASFLHEVGLRLREEPC